MRDNLPTMLRAAAKEWREKHKAVGVGEMRYDAALEEAADAIEELARDDSKLSATIKCGDTVTCAVDHSEEVYKGYAKAKEELRK